MSKLIAGYFVAEMGWLLMRWQGICRHVSKNYNGTIIGCEKEYSFLFKDFATEFKYFEDLRIKINSRNMWMSNGTTYPMEKANFLPSRNVCLENEYHQDFIKYGHKDASLKYDILIHARSTENYNTGYRNWAVDNWIELSRRLCGLRVASIGSIGGALHIAGTDDCRGIELSLLSDVMASSTVLLSPSSGPVHFASLCGLRHIVWATEKDRGIYNNRERYEKLWNPFNTSCVFIPTWQPTIEQVIENL